jgi:hypothetical protein
MGILNTWNKLLYGLHLFIYLFSKRVLPTDLTVTVGQLSLIYQDVGEETFPVRKVIINEDFDETTLANDIALLEVN